MPVSSQNEAPDPGFGLYFHWPFCRKKCPYCDFNSHVREAVDQERWVKALLEELSYFADQLPKTPLTSIFFGGGTPSLMAPSTVAALIEGAGQYFPFTEAIEVTLEANPTSVEAGSFAGYQSTGVNRLSIGVQSFNDPQLQFLGREHSAEEALAAIELARQVFRNISFDLIYALPGQTIKAWKNDLDRALDLAGDHLSLYQLTIEPNTGFAGAVRRGEFQMPEEQLAEEFFNVTQEVCLEAGRPAYEISNHARPGYECRHNLTYWRYGQYIGIGPGAHGRLNLEQGRTALQQIKRPESWLAAVESLHHGTQQEFILESDFGRAEELLLMGLRLEEGVWLKNFEEAVGKPLSETTDPSRLSQLIKGGLLELDASRLRATARGRLVLNSLLPEILRD